MTSYAAIVGAGLIIEGLFSLLHLTPETRSATVLESGIAWNYTTFRNIALVIAAALLCWRYLKTDGPEIMGMMDDPHAGQHQ